MACIELYVDSLRANRFKERYRQNELGMLDLLRVLVQHLVEYSIFNQAYLYILLFMEDGFYQFRFSISVMIIFSAYGLAYRLALGHVMK